MDTSRYKLVLTEKIIGWTDGILVILILIFTKECSLKNPVDINTSRYIINIFSEVSFSACDGGKFLLLFFLWNCIVHFTKITQIEVLEQETWRELAARVTVSVTMGTLLLTSTAYLLAIIRPPLSSVVLGISFWGMLMIALLLNKMSMAALFRWMRQRRLRRHPEELHHALIVGAGNIRAISLAENLRRPESGYSFIGFVDDISDEIVKEEGGIENDEQLEEVKQYLIESLPIVSPLEKFEKYISRHRVDEVFITLPIRSFYDQISKIIKACRLQGVKIRLLNDLFDFRKDFFSTFNEDSVSDYFHVPYVPDYLEKDLSSDLVIQYDYINHSKTKEDLKRLFDLTVSLLALSVLSPIFLIIVIIVYLDDGWPVFFAQERVGLNKRRFKMFKFRSMIKDAEKLREQIETQNEIEGAQGAAFKMSEDPRITRFGKILRKTSLDELPQFANVLIGNMSIVGPRPLPVRDFERFYKNTHRRRFSVKPGITGLWQVSGRSELNFEDWMNLDLTYIANWTFWLDIKILLKTIPVVLRGTGK